METTANSSRELSESKKNPWRIVQHLQLQIVKRRFSGTVIRSLSKAVESGIYLRVPIAGRVLFAARIPEHRWSAGGIPGAQVSQNSVKVSAQKAPVELI